MNFTAPAGADLVFTDPSGLPLETPQHILRTRVISTPDDISFVS